MKHTVSLFIVACAAAGCGAHSIEVADPEFDAGADVSVVEPDAATADGSMEMDAAVNPDAGAGCDPAGLATLTVEAVEPEVPVCHQLVMGEIGIKVGYFRLTAGPAADVDHASVTVSFLSPSGGSFDPSVRNIRLHDESGDDITAPVAGLPPDRQIPYELALAISAGGSRQVTVLMDAATAADVAVSGMNFFVEMSVRCPGDGTSRAAGPMFWIYRSRPVVTVAPDSPVGGTASTSSGQIVGKWRVTNTPNAGNYSIWFQGVVPWFVSTITVRNGGDVRLYWDTPAPANEYLHLRYRPGSLLGDDAVESTSTNPWREIASGGHRDMIAVVDSTDAHTNNTLSVGLDPEAPYPWTDEEGELVNAYQICDPPSLAWTFRY